MYLKALAGALLQSTDHPLEIIAVPVTSPWAAVLSPTALGPRCGAEFQITQFGNTVVTLKREGIVGSIRLNIDYILISVLLVSAKQNPVSGSSVSCLIVQVFFQGLRIMFPGHSVSPSFLSGFTGISHHLTPDLSFVIFFFLSQLSISVGVGEIPRPNLCSFFQQWSWSWYKQKE